MCGCVGVWSTGGPTAPYRSKRAHADEVSRAGGLAYVSVDGDNTRVCYKLHTTHEMRHPAPAERVVQARACACEQQLSDNCAAFYSGATLA